MEKATERTEHLTRGKRLASNAIMNVAGYSLPLLVALFTIPFIIRGLGSARFGILTLTWVLFSYMGLMDLGIGRALTKLLAERLGQGREHEIPELIWTGIGLMALLGLVFGILFALAMPLIVEHGLSIPRVLQKETHQTFVLLALFLPILLISIGFRGILESHQCFRLVNLVRVPLGIFTFVSPLLVLPFSNNLFHVIIVFTIGRLFACIVQMIFCLKVIPELSSGIRFSRKVLGPILRFGGWMTVSNITGPILVYIDRFLIGALVSVTAVAYYATPGEIVTKLLMISGAVIAVMFPAFSTSFSQNREHTEILFRSCVKYVFLLMFAPTLLITVFAPEGLDIWLGAEFAEHGAPVLRLLSFGIFILCIGQVPYVMIQGTGRPDLSAKLQLLELPFYLLFQWLVIRHFGIEGAAMVWVLRNIVDAWVMLFLAEKILQVPSKNRNAVMGFFPVALLFFFSSILTGIVEKCVFLIVCFSVFSILTWKKFLSMDEKHAILEKIQGIGKSKSRSSHSRNR